MVDASIVLRRLADLHADEHGLVDSVRWMPRRLRQQHQVFDDGKGRARETHERREFHPVREPVVGNATRLCDLPLPDCWFVRSG